MWRVLDHDSKVTAERDSRIDQSPEIACGTICEIARGIKVRIIGRVEEKNPNITKY